MKLDARILTRRRLSAILLEKLAPYGALAREAKRIGVDHRQLHRVLHVHEGRDALLARVAEANGYAQTAYGNFKQKAIAA